jgi:hypothetical protein
MDATISRNSTGDYVISEVEPFDDDERVVYWPDAYPTEALARRAIEIVEEGGTNPKPSIRVSMDSGERPPTRS